MKKILATLLGVITVFSLVGCNGGGGSSTSGGDGTVTEMKEIEYEMVNNWV